ncbi:MAG: ribosomal protein S18-alanine N-acetyltransferase [Promethearchaeota archaeon]
MEINKVSLKDLKQISKLERKIFKKNSFSKNLIKNLIKNNTLFLKLESGQNKKKLIGFVIVIRDKKDRANIINFLIDPEFQNRGFGSHLLQKAIDEIKKIKGIKKIILNVQISNSVAINLYERFEFKKNPDILENYYQSGENAYLMELDFD